MSDLFRRQAIDFQRQKFHGAIVLTRSPRQAAWAAFFVLVVLALIGFAATQGFARKESVAGVLLPTGGVLRVVAPQAGVVQAGAVVQGQGVEAGQVVLRLSAEQASAQGPTQTAVANTLASRQQGLQDELRQQAEQTRQQAAAIDAKLANLSAGVEQHEREIALQRERVQLVKEVAARYPDLVRTGAVSPVEVAEKNNEVLDQQARLVTLERARLAMQLELAAARAQRGALPLQAAREGSQLKREMQALAQQQVENEVRREVAVLAPQAAQVATVLAQPGQAVAAGQTLVTLLPVGTTLEAELYVPTRAAGFVHAGTPVLLRVDAFPYARFGQLAGRVREVSQSAVPPSDLVSGGGDAAAPDALAVYRVRVVLEPAGAAGSGVGALAWRQSLKPGMHVQASLVAEKRSLIEWALEPLETLRAAAR